MPIYCFKCDECGKEFESLMKPFEQASCVHCKAENVTKLISTHKGYEIRGDNSASTKPNSS